jgi:hypothetical protein
MTFFYARPVIDMVKRENFLFLQTNPTNYLIKRLKVSILHSLLYLLQLVPIYFWDANHHENVH